MNASSRVRCLRNVPQYICPSCQRALRRRSFRDTIRLSFHNATRLRESARNKGWIAAPGEQAMPLTGFYAEMLSHSLHVSGSATRSLATPLPPDQSPKTAQEETLAKARLVFGSRLAGPIERAKKIESLSTNIAGIMVPPRPEEPDNCCMSGCVNCVWDQYRDDMEEWAAKSALAQERLSFKKADTAKRKRKVGGASKGTGRMLAGEDTPDHVATSMDDDGGGSEALWDGGTGRGESADLFKDIPVGIREFMKTEKMLKEKHRAEGPSARPL